MYVSLCAKFFFFFFFKQKTAYEMSIGDWSSDVCSSDLIPRAPVPQMAAPQCVPSPIATPRTALPASEARQTRGEFRAVLQAGRSPAAMRVARPTLPHAERGSWTLAILQRDTNRIVVSEGSQPYGLP